MNPVKAVSLLALYLLPCLSFAMGQVQNVHTVPSRGSFSIVQQKVAATLYVDADDYAGVLRAAGDLSTDIARVTDCTPPLTHDRSGLGKHAIIAGTIGNSRLIDRSIQDRKIQPTPIKGKWGVFLY